MPSRNEVVEPKYRLVKVQWVDSQGSSGWHMVEDILDTPAHYTMISVGWLIVDVDDNDEYICVAPHFSMSGSEQCKGDVIIPKVAVMSITEIK